MSIHKKRTSVRLEEALIIAGSGIYTNYVTIITGAIYFCALISCQSIAIIMPAVGCDLGLSNATKGTMASMTFTGMLFSGQLFGFLADNFGRKRVALHSQIIGTFVLIACGLAPDIPTLMVMLFLNGFILTGVLTSAYVYISEITSIKDRAKAVIALTAIGGLANVYLPGMAWLIMPLNLNVPIVGDMRFTSWRLFIILLVVPIISSTFLLWTLPESPKFLLSQGKPDEALDILKSIFALNNKKRRESYPVLTVRLDANDHACESVDSSGNMLVTYFKMMMRQTYLLFSKKYVLYTLLSIALMFGVVGGFNTLFLWFPDQVSRIRHYSLIHEVYNVTLCDIMSSKGTVEAVPNCQLNYSFFAVNIMLGCTQFITCLLSGLAAEKIGRKLCLLICLSISSVICFCTLFITNEYLTIGSLGLMTVLLYLVFPITVSVIVEFFPTPLRSTAVSIIMIFGRFGATVGSQLMGALYSNHCEKGYIGMSLILSVAFIICLILPVRKEVSIAPKEEHKL